MIRFLILSLFTFSAFGKSYCFRDQHCEKVSMIGGTATFIVKTGIDVTGNPTCRQVAYDTEKIQKVCLKNKPSSLGRCVDVSFDAVDTFDPNDPAACDGAIDLTLLDRALP